MGLKYFFTFDPLICTLTYPKCVFYQAHDSSHLCIQLPAKLKEWRIERRAVCFRDR